MGEEVLFSFLKKKFGQLSAPTFHPQRIDLAVRDDWRDSL